MFVLLERLARATAEVGDLPLCRVLLLNDRRFAWLLLVPRREGVEPGRLTGTLQAQA